MANKLNLKNPIVLIALIVGAIFIFRQGGIFTGAITGAETMTRTGPDMVDPSSTFQIAYTVIGASGSWGASIEDSATGGCTFPSGQSTIKTVMLSEDGSIKTLTINAPSSGTCTFTGDYKFGEFPVTSLNAYSVSVCSPTCTRPGDLCTESSTVSDGCGGMCDGSWTVTQLTPADINCDSSISRIELGQGILDWILGSFSRNNLGLAIQDWAAGG